MNDETPLPRLISNFLSTFERVSYNDLCMASGLDPAFIIQELVSHQHLLCFEDGNIVGTRIPDDYKKYMYLRKENNGFAYVAFPCDDEATNTQLCSTRNAERDEDGITWFLIQQHDASEDAFARYDEAGLGSGVHGALYAAWTKKKSR